MPLYVSLEHDVALCSEGNGRTKEPAQGLAFLRVRVSRFPGPPQADPLLGVLRQAFHFISPGLEPVIRKWRMIFSDPAVLCEVV